jgi:hypothetical protein
MKKLMLGLAVLTILNIAPSWSQSFADHGGGNGGDDLEMTLKKRSLQIGYFIKSSVGAKVFTMLNGESIVNIVNTMDIDVTTGNVTDKYGTLRTCVNEPERALITCNVKRLNDLVSKKQDDILTAVLFHEILGLMGLELGYQDNVSMYPVSSKIIPYNDIVTSTAISEAQIRPEFFGLDQRSYGLTIKNKETKETIRMICLNDNVEVNRCRNYAVVRSANGLQTPVDSSIVAVSPKELSHIELEKIKPGRLLELETKLNKIHRRGFKFVTLGWQTEECGYAFGIGFTQTAIPEECWGAIVFFGVPAVIDAAIEIPKQAINMPLWPIKATINGIRSLNVKSKINRINKKVSLARKVLNLDNDLSLVGKTNEIKNEDYNTVVEIIKASLKTVKQ